jgi:hypothetical protein
VDPDLTDGNAEVTLIGDCEIEASVRGDHRLRNLESPGRWLLWWEQPVSKGEDESYDADGYSSLYETPPIDSAS